MANSGCRLSIALAAFLLVGWLSGCGSDNQDSRQSTSNTKQQTRPALSQEDQPKPDPRQQPKRRFIRQANAICRTLTPRAEAIRRRYLFEANSALRQQGFAALAREVSAALSKIRALRQPNVGKKEIRRLYGTARAGISELERAATNDEAAGKILSGVDPFAKTALIAQAYGLSSCRETGLTTPP